MSFIFLFHLATPLELGPHLSQGAMLYLTQQLAYVLHLPAHYITRVACVKQIFTTVVSVALLRGLEHRILGEVPYMRFSLRKVCSPGIGDSSAVQHRWGLTSQRCSALVALQYR
jgi:hypothetical protein